jgi:TonB-dependent starch-binding outer membrane protein SusC
MKFRIHPLREGNFYPALKKILIIMKLSVLILMLGIMQVAASVHSQPVHVTFDRQEVKVGEALAAIEKSSDYKFFYRNDQVDLERTVRLGQNYDMLNELLETLFKNTDIGYRMVDNKLVILTQTMPQPQSIKGTVKTSNGGPLPGATILVKGTTKGTATDVNGSFLVDAQKGDVLVFSAIGHQSVEVKVGDGPVNIILTAVASTLDEIQVIAYGTTSKRLNTGSVATIKSSAIASQPLTNPMLALQGQVAGVSITNSQPGLGSPVKPIIRGINSLTSGTDPLIIIDGVAINDAPGGLISGNTTAYTSGGTNAYSGISPLNGLNLNDIESMDILKDADATSIYGSRGTNGVILITTKSAKLGTTRFTIDVSTGLNSPSYVSKKLNTADYLQLRKDAFAMGNATATSAINPITPTTYNAPDLMLWKQDAYTNWNKMILGNRAPIYTLNASATGGTKYLNFYSSVGYSKIYDVLPNDPYQERITSLLKLNHTSANDRFKMGLNVKFGTEKQAFTQTGTNSTVSTMYNVPNMELYKPDSTVNIVRGSATNGYTVNPVPLSLITSESKTKNIALATDLSYEIIKGLSAKFLFDYNLQMNELWYVYPGTALSAQDAYTTVRNSYNTHLDFSSISYEPQLTYTTKILKGNLSALTGLQFLEKSDARSSVTISNPASDILLKSYASGASIGGGSNLFVNKFNSVYARANYNWDNKYIVNANFRRDGSSRFAPANRFGNFGSAGLAWLFSNEDWVKNAIPFLSFGKLRGSYGITGNNNIADFQYLSLLSSSPYYAYSGNGILIPGNVPNDKVKWETTHKMDIGLNLGFFNDRILLNTTYFRTLSVDLLTSIPLASQSGWTSYAGNFAGEVENKGWEFELNTDNLGKNSAIRWSTAVNVTTSANKLVKYPNLDKSNDATSLQIGRAIKSSFYSMEMPFHLIKINPDNGVPVFVDYNKDGMVSFSDASINAAWIGTALPTIWGGITNKLSYKGFNLDLFVQFSKQTMAKWDYTLSFPPGSMMNPPEIVKDNYWKQPGDVKPFPRLYTGVTGIAAYTQPVYTYYFYSDAALYRGFYWRLKNVQLSYNLPAAVLSKLKFVGATIYFRGENLCFYTREKLYKDPEASDGQRAPLLRTFTTGIQVTF